MENVIFCSNGKSLKHGWGREAIQTKLLLENLMERDHFGYLGGIILNGFKELECEDVNSIELIEDGVT